MFEIHCWFYASCRTCSTWAWLLSCTMWPRSVSKTLCFKQSSGPPARYLFQRSIMATWWPWTPQKIAARPACVRTSWCISLFRPLCPANSARSQDLSHHSVAEGPHWITLNTNALQQVETFTNHFEYTKAVRATAMQPVSFFELCTNIFGPPRYCARLGVKRETWDKNLEESIWWCQSSQISKIWRHWYICLNGEASKIIKSPDDT